MERVCAETFEQLVKKVLPVLRRIAYRLSRQYREFTCDDLLQEALIHLWKEFAERKLFDKTDSYILQGCYFCLKNYIRTASQRMKLVPLEYSAPGDDEPGQESVVEMPLKGSDSHREAVHCSLIIEAIRNNGLTSREKEVFLYALEGLTTREIGSRLGISHVRVVKLRQSLKEKCKKHMDIF